MSALVSKVTGSDNAIQIRCLQEINYVVNVVAFFSFWGIAVSANHF